MSGKKILKQCVEKLTVGERAKGIQRSWMYSCLRSASLKLFQKRKRSRGWYPHTHHIWCGTEMPQTWPVRSRSHWGRAHQDCATEDGARVRPKPRLGPWWAKWKDTGIRLLLALKLLPGKVLLLPCHESHKGSSDLEDAGPSCVPRRRVSECSANRWSGAWHSCLSSLLSPVCPDEDTGGRGDC